MANPQTEMILCQQTFITKGIFQKGCYTQLTILSQFKALKFINLTCYGWSSPSHTLLLGASTHWITEDFKYWGIVLSLKTINRPHMGLNLSHHNNEMLKSFNIVDKIYWMTAWLHDCLKHLKQHHNGTSPQRLISSIQHQKTSSCLYGAFINMTRQSGIKKIVANQGGHIQRFLPTYLSHLVDQSQAGNFALSCSKFKAVSGMLISLVNSQKLRSNDWQSNHNQTQGFLGLRSINHSIVYSQHT